ncbi:MAG: hypothetical protein HZA64_11870 [Rhodocyclales bacterium]|nr:hypothetical protein [Rhodocyclales bacterium]
MNDESRHTKLDVEVTATGDELSLKAKGAGLLVLISICLIGIILLGLKTAETEKGYSLFLPILFLAYTTNSLIATIDAVLGLTVRVRD